MVHHQSTHHRRYHMTLNNVTSSASRPRCLAHAGQVSLSSPKLSSIFLHLRKMHVPFSAGLALVPLMFVAAASQDVEVRGVFPLTFRKTATQTVSDVVRAHFPALPKGHNTSDCEFSSFWHCEKGRSCNPLLLGHNSLLLYSTYGHDRLVQECGKTSSITFVVVLRDPLEQVGVGRCGCGCVGGGGGVCENVSRALLARRDKITDTRPWSNCGPWHTRWCACVDFDDGDGDGDGDHELSSALYFWGYGGNKKSEFSDELKALLSEVRPEEPRFVRVRRRGGKGGEGRAPAVRVLALGRSNTRRGWNLSHRPPTRPPALLPPVSSPHVSLHAFRPLLNTPTQHNTTTRCRAARARQICGT